MGKKESKRNSKIRLSKILEDAYQYPQDEASDPMVFQTSATEYFAEYQAGQPQATLAYTPNSQSNSMEYYLPLPQDDSIYQVPAAQNAQSIIDDDLLSRLKIQVAGSIAVASYSSEYVSPY